MKKYIQNKNHTGLQANFRLKMWTIFQFKLDFYGPFQI